MYGREQTRKILKQLKLAGVDGLLLVNKNPPVMDPAFYYFSGARDFENSDLLIKQKPKMWVPEFELARAKQESWIQNIKKFEKGTIDKIVKELKGKTIGINGDFLPVTFYSKLKKLGVKMKDISALVEECRLIKTKDEIRILTKAAKATKKMFDGIDVNKTELEINADLGYNLMKQDMEFGYDPIIAFDKKSALPHSFPAAIKGKWILMVDAGARYKGYTVDMTRTFMINPTKEMRKVYCIVREAQQMAIEMIRPGIVIGEIDTAVQAFLKSKGYKNPHSTGHGIGLAIHEKPYISEKTTDILMEGMTFTVEPGVYLPGKFGIRIEDDVVVTKTGCRVLTR